MSVPHELLWTGELFEKATWLVQQDQAGNSYPPTHE